MIKQRQIQLSFLMNLWLTHSKQSPKASAYLVLHKNGDDAAKLAEMYRNIDTPPPKPRTATITDFPSLSDCLAQSAAQANFVCIHVTELVCRYPSLPAWSHRSFRPSPRFNSSLLLLEPSLRSHFGWCLYLTDVLTPKNSCTWSAQQTFLTSITYWPWNSPNETLRMPLRSPSINSTFCNKHWYVHWHSYSQSTISVCLGTLFLSRLFLAWPRLQHTWQPVFRYISVDPLPGSAYNRGTALGRLNWCYTAATDAIAWCTVHPCTVKLLRHQWMASYNTFLLL